jgi:putative oxidoreductase
MNALETRLASLQPHLLSLLRVIVGLLLLQHGLMKLFGFPGPFMRPLAVGELVWIAGALELVGGALLVLGLLTRPTAFILAGLMAFAYFIGHAGRGFYPILNGGNLAVLYCFVLLYLAAAGGGPWSVDARRGAPRAT